MTPTHLRTGIFLIILIIVTLALMFPPKLNNTLSHGKAQIAKIHMKALEGALQLFRYDIGRFPTTDEGLAALARNPGNLKTWRGPYLSGQAVPNDPWTRPYIYRSPVEHWGYVLLSYGRDGIPGGEGEDADIMSPGGFVRFKRDQPHGGRTLLFQLGDESIVEDNVPNQICKILLSCRIRETRVRISRDEFHAL